MEQLIDRMKEMFLELKGRIEDSSLFQTLKEKYDTLAPRSQKILNGSIIGFVALTIVSCPYSDWSMSSDNLHRFENARNMMRNLLRAVQVSSQLAGISPDLDISSAVNRVQSEINNFGLQQEQIAGIRQVEAAEAGTLLAPPAIQQAGIAVQLKKLNLRQIVDLGHRLQSIQSSVRLAGMDLSANADNDHYFDVTFQLVNFSIPGSSSGGSTGSAAGTPPPNQGSPGEIEEDLEGMDE